MKVNKHAILTVLSVAGAIGAVAVTAYMAPKAEAAIKAKKKESSDKLELAKVAAPYYIPSALLLILSTGATLLNNKDYKKELLLTSATAGYLMMNKNQLEETLKQNSDMRELANRAKTFLFRKEDGHRKDRQTIEETGKGDLLVIDGYSGRIFRSSEEAVKEAEEKLNDMFHSEKVCNLNDFYRFLGIEVTHFGHQYGWVNEEDWFDDGPLDFENTLIKKEDDTNPWGEDVLVIDLYTYPIEYWQEI